MKAGDRVGRYQLVRELGRGGMGSVWVALDPAAGREVALKLLHRAGSPAACERFQREAEALARLDHPGVLRVHDVAIAAQAVPHLATELLEGQGLEQACAAGPIDPRRAAELVLALASTLRAVHGAGVLHRDLKPSNVLLRGDGRPVLLDFGLARLGELERLTQSGALVGTPAYMAPEQAEEGHGVDERADVYGLGAVLYHLLTGRPPYQGQAAIEVLHALLTRDPAWPRALRREVPVGLDAIVRRAMARDPAARYASAAELERALAAWLGGEDARGPRAVGRLAAGLLLLALALAGWTLLRPGQPAAGELQLDAPPREAARALDPAPPEGLLARHRRARWPRESPLCVLVDPDGGQREPKLAFLDDWRLLVACPRRWLVWDLRDPDPRPRVLFRRDDERLLTRLALLPDGEALACQGDEVLRVALATRGPTVWWKAPPSPDHPPVVQALSCVGGRVALGGPGVGVRLLDLGRATLPSPADLGPPQDLALSRDGRWLLCVWGISGKAGGARSAGTIELWELGGAPAQVQRAERVAMVRSAIWLGEGRFAVGHELGEIELHELPWDPAREPLLLDGRVHDVIGINPRAHLGSVTHLVGEGAPTRRLWSISYPYSQHESSLRVWDLARRELVHAWDLGPDDPAVSLAVSPDGALVAVARAGGRVELHGAPP